MAIETKPDLKTTADNTLPDNTTQEISAADVRELIKDFVDSNRAFLEQIINTTPSTIDLTSDVVYCGSGADVVTIPLADNFKTRQLVILNATPNLMTLNCSGSDVINGSTSQSYQLDPFSVITLVPSDTFDAWFVVSSNRTLANLFAYDEDNTDATVLVAQDDYQDIDCTLSEFVGFFSSVFNVNGNIITYTGKRTITVNMEWFATIVTGQDKIYKIKALHNDTTPMFGSASCQTNKHCSIGFTSRVVLAENDTIVLKIAGVDTTQNPIVTDQTIQIRELRQLLIDNG